MPSPLFDVKSAANALSDVRSRAPLVHSVTNAVSMNPIANALLALGASPLMAHALEEMEELSKISQALVLNIGTLDGPSISAMSSALRFSSEAKLPCVLDPVGVGATTYRTQVCWDLLEQGGVTAIRGNASEITALAGGAPTSKGVDSTLAPAMALPAAKSLSSRFDCVVCVSGPRDLIVGKNSQVQILNGDPLMTKVTGMGCIASAVIGAFLASTQDPLIGTAAAMGVMGVSGEIARSRSSGPGSFMSAFLDAVATLTPEALTERLRFEAI